MIFFCDNGNFHSSPGYKKINFEAIFIVETNDQFTNQCAGKFCANTFTKFVSIQGTSERNTNDLSCKSKLD